MKLLIITIAVKLLSGHGEEAVESFPQVAVSNDDVPVTILRKLDTIGQHLAQMSTPTIPEDAGREIDIVDIHTLLVFRAYPSDVNGYTVKHKIPVTVGGNTYDINFRMTRSF